MVSGRRIAGVLGGLGVGAVGGFVGSLLRSRPATIYADGLDAGNRSGHGDAVDDLDGRLDTDLGGTRSKLPVAGMEEV